MAQILRIPAAEYHQRPGLSSSIAATLIASSPLHAWTQHPIFGGRGKNPTPSMDRGSVVHRLVLGAGADYEALDFDDWRTKAAKTARDAARDAGKIPIKTDDLEAALEIALKVAEQLRARGIALDGESELAIEWDEDSAHGPVVCRGMMDHVWLADGRIVDLKIVANASPGAVERSAENFGYAIQRAAYTRALVALDPSLAGRVDFLFAFCEPEPPYAMNLCRPDGAFRELGERRWLRAVAAWGECLAKDRWPGYGDGINPIAPPAWALAREEFAP